MSCNTPLISVIIPVYNEEKYVRECIESVQAQTYSNLEIIVVDNGSTDRSHEIIDSMARQDNRIKLVSQANNGVSMARNYGLDIARGEYITFVDSDDTVDTRYIEVLFILLASNGADMSVCTVSSNKEHYDFTNDTYEVVEASGFVVDVLYKRYSDNSVCGKLYKRHLWKSVRFKKMRFEDLEIFPRLCLKASKVVITDAPLYHYTINISSFMHSITPDRFDMLLATQLILNYLNEIEAREELKKAARSRRVRACFNAFFLSHGLPQYREVNDKAWNGIKEYRIESMFNRESPLMLRFAATLSYLGRHPLVFINRLLHISK